MYRVGDQSAGILEPSWEEARRRSGTGGEEVHRDRMRQQTRSRDRTRGARVVQVKMWDRMDRIRSWKSEDRRGGRGRERREGRKAVEAARAVEGRITSREESV